MRADRFEKWLLVEALEILVAAGVGDACSRSRAASTRCATAPTTSSLVVDHRNADETRSVRTLVGRRDVPGVARARARARATSSPRCRPARGAKLDAIFLDEGFGTLDADTLDTVATHDRVARLRRAAWSASSRTCPRSPNGCRCATASRRDRSHGVGRPGRTREVHRRSVGSGVRIEPRVRDAAVRGDGRRRCRSRRPTQWAPGRPDPATTAPAAVLFVDGVRRHRSAHVDRHRRRRRGARHLRVVRGRASCAATARRELVDVEVGPRRVLALPPRSTTSRPGRPLRSRTRRRDATPETLNTRSTRRHDRVRSAHRRARAAAAPRADRARRSAAQARPHRRRGRRHQVARRALPPGRARPRRRRASTRANARPSSASTPRRSVARRGTSGCPVRPAGRGPGIVRCEASGALAPETVCALADRVDGRAPPVRVGTAQGLRGRRRTCIRSAVSSASCGAGSATRCCSTGRSGS